jgi:hypothetical protein
MLGLPAVLHVEEVGPLAGDQAGGPRDHQP